MNSRGQHCACAVWRKPGGEEERIWRRCLQAVRGNKFAVTQQTKIIWSSACCQLLSALLTSINIPVKCIIFVTWVWPRSEWLKRFFFLHCHWQTGLQITGRCWDRTRHDTRFTAHCTFFTLKRSDLESVKLKRWQSHRLITSNADNLENIIYIFMLCNVIYIFISCILPVIQQPKH